MKFRRLQIRVSRVQAPTIPNRGTDLANRTTDLRFHVGSGRRTTRHRQVGLNWQASCKQTVNVPAPTSFTVLDKTHNTLSASTKPLTMPRHCRIHFTSLHSSLVNLPISLYGPLLERGVVSPHTSPARLYQSSLTCNTETARSCGTSYAGVDHSTIVNLKRGQAKARGVCRLDGHGLRVLTRPLQLE